MRKKSIEMQYDSYEEIAKAFGSPGCECTEIYLYTDCGGDEPSHYKMVRRPSEKKALFSSPCVGNIKLAWSKYQGSLIPYNKIRRQANEAIGEVREPKKVEPLIQALNDNDSIARQKAVKALEKNGDPKAIEALIQTLSDKDMGVRGLAVAALTSIGSNGAIEPLIQALGNEDVNIRISAQQSLSKISGDEVVEALIESLNEKNDNIRIGAVSCLKGIADKKAFKPCLKALNDENPHVRNQAVHALAAIDGEKSVEPLIKVINSDKHFFNRGAAVWRLGEIGDERAVESLYNAIDDDNEKLDLQRKAVIALRKIGGEKATEFLIKALNRKDIKIKNDVIAGLGEIGDERAVEPLSKFLTDDSEERKKLTKTALLLIKIRLKHSKHSFMNDQEITRLINNLVSENEYLRNKAFDRLKKAGDVAVQPLIKSLEHKNLMIRRQAVEALSMINTQGCIKALLNVFGDPRGEMFRRTEYVLWLIGEKAVNPLINILNDDNPKVRGRAAIALGHMIHKRRTDPSNRIWLDPSSIDITDNIRNDINVGRVRSQVRRQIKKLLKDKDENVKKYASYALEKL